MSEKRKDSKGRVLQAGEYQKADGRYEYRYEYLGRAFSIYSWRLVESDPVPPEKRNKPALRTMKKDLVKDLSDGIQSGDAKKLTLNECADKLFEIRRFELAPTTIYIYEYLYNTYVRNVIGKQTLQTFTQSKIKAFYARLSIEKKAINLNNQDDSSGNEAKF